MLNISVEKINLRSPHKVSFSTSNGTFYFSSHFGREYTIGFVEETLLTHSGVYQFFIYSDKYGKKDSDIFITIVAILEAYFEAGALALSYVCDVRDGRQCARSRLFAHWFHEYPFRNQYEFISRKIEVEETEYYIAIIVRKDNLLCYSVINEFEELVSDLDSQEKKSI